MSDFPKGGDVQMTRDWLDKEGFDGLFVGWKADALLGQEEVDILSYFNDDAGTRDKGLQLCGLLATARETKKSKKQKVEIIFKEEGKFLELTGVPSFLKSRSKLGKYLYIRDCYDDIIAEIAASLPKKWCKAVAILGTAGIGKRSLFLVVLKLLLEDPARFGLSTRSFYFQTRQSKIWLYQHEAGDSFSFRFHPIDEHLDESIILFADMETDGGSPNEHCGISLIFTSLIPSHFKELTKSGWRKIMPTWSADEQVDLFNSPQFEKEYGREVAQRACDNISYFGGSIRSNIQVAVDALDPLKIIGEEITTMGAQICERYFKAGAGFACTEKAISDVLVHMNPFKENGKYDFDTDLCAYSFASPYILRQLLQLNDSMLVTHARKKYYLGTFSGCDNGYEFELLCLHGFKISDVEFLAQPLTDNAHAIKVKFPPKQVLALNWREQQNYLEANVLYIPPYDNLECGDSFCLIEINGKWWTLVILQFTIAENHPVKQNGVKIIHDCFTKNAGLKVDDTVIMFMIPLNGKLKTKQPLVAQKKGEGGVPVEVQRVTIAVAAQYKIENALATVDAD